MEIIEAKNVKEFLEIISRDNQRWLDVNDENQWVYRGQNNSEWELKPSSLRDDIYKKDFMSFRHKELEKKIAGGIKAADFIQETTENLFQNIRNTTIPKDINIKNLNDIVIQTHTEYTLLTRFLITCNLSALHLEEIHIPILDYASDSLGGSFTEDYISKLKSFLIGWLNHCFHSMARSPNNKTLMPLFRHKNYYAMALAQHSGIPTRLTDWTSNPYIAAFFSAHTSTKNQEKLSHICVYAFNTKYHNFNYRNSINIHRLLKHNNFEFLHQQMGILIETGGADFYYLKYGKWPTLGEHIKEFDKNGKENGFNNFKKITLPIEYADELLKKLDFCYHINKARLMPTYFHVAEHILEK